MLFSSAMYTVLLASPLGKLFCFYFTFLFYLERFEKGKKKEERVGYKLKIHI